MNFSRKRHADISNFDVSDADELHRHPKPPFRTVAKKSKCSIHSAATSDPTVAPTGLSIVVQIVVVTVLSEVAAVEVSVETVEIVVIVVIVVHVAVMEDLRLRTLRTSSMINGTLTNVADEEALRLRVASETYMCQRVADGVVAADVVTGLANAVGHLRLGGPGHPFAAAAVRPLPAAQGAHHHDDRGEVHPAALDLLLAAPVVPLRGLPRVVIELEATTGHSPQAMIAEGCAGLALGLLHQSTSLAHHPSGCRVLGPEALRAVDEVVLNPAHPIHDLSPQKLIEQRRTDADVPHLLKTLNHELM